MSNFVGRDPRMELHSHSPLRGWLAVFAVTLGIFGLMTSELLPVGLLSPVSSALNISEGSAGLMVTVPGLVAAISAPIIAISTSKIDRRIVLAVLIALVASANLVSAFATSFGVVLAARFLVGISVGGFWALAGGIALRLVPERHVPRATAVIFAGVETASVFGVPLGTIIGDLVGWRFAFAMVGILGLVALTALVLLMPQVPSTRTITLSDLPQLLATNRLVRIGLAMTLLVVTGHFVAYTFVRPIMTSNGIDAAHIGFLLLAFGVAGICGNFIAGALIRTHLWSTALAISIVLAAAMVAVIVFGNGPTSATVILSLWGVGYGALPVTFQSWIMHAAPENTEAATSLYVSAFNFSIALGALFGGLSIDYIGVASVLCIGATLCLIALVLVVTLGRLTAAKPKPDEGQNNR